MGVAGLADDPIADVVAGGNNVGVLLVGAETTRFQSSSSTSTSAATSARRVTGALWTVDGGLTQSTGAAGAQAGRGAATPPRGTIDLKRSRDGTRNKQVLKLL